MSKPTKIPRTIKAQLSAADVTIEAGEGRTPSFSAIVYAGGPLSAHVTPPLPHKVVVDLAGLSLAKKSIPILRDHSPARHIGHTTEVTNDGREITASGMISGGGKDAAEVLAAAKNDFTWSASIGADMSSIELVKVNQTVRINGQQIAGPVFVSRKTRLNEISFLTVGADTNAAVRIAARNNMAKKNGKAAIMNDEENSSDVLEAGDDIAEEISADARELEIHRLCGAAHADIAETAIERDFTDQQIAFAIKAKRFRGELSGLQMRTTHRPNTGTGPDQGAVIEAALAMTGGMDPKFLEANGTDKRVIDAAMAPNYRGMGLQQAMRCVVQANGRGSGNLNGLSLINAAFEADRQMQASGGFSTVSLPNLFANVANKFLLESFYAVEQAWRRISAKRSVSDFKTNQSYRILGDSVFDELPADGEIRHGTLSETGYTNRAKTFAKMYSVTRTDLRNDDLNALTTIPRKLGRGAAIKLCRVFWATWLADSTYFSAGNNNYITGAGTALSLAGLTAAEVAFYRQTDGDGESLALRPSILLVPPELAATARELVMSENVNTGGAATDTRVPSGNSFNGAFEIVVSAYLSATKVWYLLASPNELPAIEVAFLDGRETPFIEQADVDFSRLGVDFRGYFDAGVALAETAAALKVKGEA